MENYYQQFENCLQYEKPDCQKTCPFGVDILDFQEKMSKRQYNLAYKTFRDSVGFPDIAATLCPQYCGDKCPRSEIDQAVQLNLLEKTCVAKATRKDATAYNVPAKDKRVAIVGGGISGLACALKLCNKKFNVTIYEKSDRLGGQLWELMSPEIFLDDIERQLKLEKYELNLNTEIKRIDEFSSHGFDAIYIATGSGGEEFGTLSSDGGFCYEKNKMAVFDGGSLTGNDKVHSLANGLDMAWSIEYFFQTGRLKYPEDEKWESLVIDQDRFEKAEPVSPTDSGIFTDEEVVLEAGRCMRCQCDPCMSYCPLSEYFGKWPLQMRDEIMTTTMSSGSMIHKTPALRLINMCTRCERCEDGCPAHIQLGEMIREARYKLHDLDRMPGAYHQFWVRDMIFANGKYSKLITKAPGQEKCTYAFFPGCQVGAADPEYVLKPYKWLLTKYPDTGLMLRCCGVPADWAGNEEMFKEELESLEREWESLGKPTLVTLCPSCMRHIKRHLPEVKVISLYEIMEKQDFPTGADNRIITDETYCVFDPCSTKGERPMQEAVRDLVTEAGLNIEELPKKGIGGCCGFGGNSRMVKSDYGKFVADKSSELSDNPYLTYCINCRDIFQSEGKKVIYILDILFDINKVSEELPGISKRRENRASLKEILLKEIWDQGMEENYKASKYDLLINEDIHNKMQNLKILVEDISEVLEFSLRTGRRTFDAETEIYTSYKELGAITCWVQYRPAGDTFEIINVYTHRMKIELEAVWNGRKTDLDV